MTGIYGELDPKLMHYDAYYRDEEGVLCHTFVDHCQLYVLLGDFDVVSYSEV